MSGPQSHLHRNNQNFRHCILRLHLVTFFLMILLTTIWSAHVPAIAQVSNRIPLAQAHMPPALTTARLVGRMANSQRLTLSLVLPYRNQALLNELLHRLYDPGDPLFGQYLTPEQFTRQFGPRVSDLNIVLQFAKSQGLHVEEISPNRTSVKISGFVKTVEQAFAIQMNEYIDGSGRSFYALDRQPTLPIPVAHRLLGILGLHNASVMRPFSHQVVQKRLPVQSIEGALPGRSGEPLPDVSAPSYFVFYSGNAGLSPSDIRTLYNLPGDLPAGSGQVLGLYEQGTFTPSDITAYENFYSLPHIPLKIIPVDGYNINSSPGGDAAEITLDAEMMAALAPGASQIRIYEGTDSAIASGVQEFHDSLMTMANDSVRPNIISVSYGSPELSYASVDFEFVNQSLQQLALQGQTVCVASGDAAAWADQSGYPNEMPNASDPGAEAYVLSVGGTDLTDDFNINYVTETSWFDSLDTGRGDFGTGGGGGFSDYWSIPSWQVGAFKTSVNPQGSLKMRNFPDVALYGDYDTGGYDVYFTDPTYGAGWYGYNGTSASSPLWAAFLADVNQARLASKLPVLGFANPAIYKIAESTAYSTCFQDINDGSNNGYYNTVKGYDNSTGWGSFNGANLLQALSTQKSLPTLTGFTPTGGSVGTRVTLTGTNFGGTTGVKFNATAATTFSVVSATSLVVTVPTGATTGKITVTTPGGSTTSTGIFTVSPPPPALALTANPTSIAGGHHALGTITLGMPAPTGGTSITLSSNNAAAVPAQTIVTVSAGQTTAHFAINTKTVTGDTSVTLTGKTGTLTATFTVTVTATRLSALTFAPVTVEGGLSTLLTISLNGPAPAGGSNITLNSSNTTVLPIPARVTIPAGSNALTIQVDTGLVNAVTNVTVTGTAGAVSLSAPLSVTP